MASVWMKTGGGPSTTASLPFESAADGWPSSSRGAGGTVVLLRWALSDLDAENDTRSTRIIDRFGQHHPARRSCGTWRMGRLLSMHFARTNRQ
jgi:hypothetical protein